MLVALLTLAGGAAPAPDHMGNAANMVADIESAALIVGVQGAETSREWPAQLSEAELAAVYELAGVPEAWRADLARIAWCESSWSPGAVGDGGNSLGLHQMNRLWFTYAGEDPEQWADPVVNTRAALGAARYDLAKGYPIWKQWTCQP